MISPPTDTFVEGLSSRSLWSGLEQRLLPSDKWFGLVDMRHFASRKGDETTGVETGSLGEHANDAKGAGSAPQTAAPIGATSAATPGADATRGLVSP